MNPPKPSSSASLLRGIAVSEEPRTLLRPGSKPSSPIVPSLLPQGGQAPFGYLDRLPAKEQEPVSHSGANLSQEGYREGFEQGRQEGFEEGKKQGLDQGLIEGRESGAQESLRQTKVMRDAMTLRVEKLDQLFTSLSTQLNEQITSRLLAMEEDMVALCHAVLCRIFGDQALKRNMIVHEVRQAIEQCCGSGTQASLSGLLAIHVHPQDLEIMKGDADLAAWLKQHGASAIPWVPDDQVRLGGCIVRSNQGNLDARLETQLASLRDFFLEGRSTSEGLGTSGTKDRRLE